MIIIMGLGNTGKAYANTRHNVGFWCINSLARLHKVPLSKKHRYAHYGEGAIAGQPAVLVTPRTFVNRSGAAARYFLDRYHQQPNSLFVIHDDMDLPLGRIRIRPGGSAAGHNGIKSIIAELGTEDFPRLRIGIGKPADQDAISFVLGGLSPQESHIIREVIELASKAVDWMVRHGIDSAMSAFNQRVITADD